MAYETNTVVTKLNGYLLFNSDHSNIYEEYQTSADSIELNTKALSYLKKIYKTNARLIILTGDAGHRKTHLCRRIIETVLGYSESEARTLIKTFCDGSKVIYHSSEERYKRGFHPILRKT